MSYYRKRTALACAFCRSRKRRCDARRPACSNCLDSGVDCRYDDMPPQRIDTSGGTKEILSRLRDMESMLEHQGEKLGTLLSSGSGVVSSSRQPPPAHEASPHSQGGMPVTGTQPSATVPFTPWPPTGGLEIQSDMSHLPPLSIPVKHRTSSSYLLGLPPMKSLIGEYPTDLLHRVESKNALPEELELGGGWGPQPHIDLDEREADGLVAQFFALAHPHHPILDEEEFGNVYRQFLRDGPDTSMQSALCMTVLAIGHVCSSRSALGPLDFGRSPPGMSFMQHAMPTLITQSSWSFAYSLIVPQALVLASMYFSYIVRPLHSWRLMYSASTILQFMLSRIDSTEGGPSAKEAIIRLFWSCFLIECDRLAEMELPRTGLQQVADEMSLPSCTNLDSTQSTCYLAEISVRRLLNRVHNSLYPSRKHVLSPWSATPVAPDDYSIQDIASIMSVCDELYSQLRTWHSSIPEPHRPALETSGFNDARQNILRIRYFAARHIIYRPFVLYIIAHGTQHTTDAMVERAALCLDSCRNYVLNATMVLGNPSQYTWTFSVSSLGAIIILTLASLSPDLKHMVPDIDELQTTTIKSIQPWAFSSLETVVSILEDVRKKQRILSRV